MITLPNNNTAASCLNLCSSFGYPAAGLEYSDQCCKLPSAAQLRRRLTCYISVCGDVSDVTNSGGTAAPETDCNMPCSGNGAYLCGGPSRLQLYLWNGTLNNWQTPSNIGYYEVNTPAITYTMCCAEGLSIDVVFHARTCASTACHCWY